MIATPTICNIGQPPPMKELFGMVNHPARWRNFRLTPLELLIIVLVVFAIIFLISLWTRATGNSETPENNLIISPTSLLEQALVANEENIQKIKSLTQEIQKLQNSMEPLKEELAAQKKEIDSLKKKLADYDPKLAIQSVNGSTPPRSESKEIIHRVAGGETLNSIAVKYKVTVKKLRSWNNLSDNALIKAGQKLIIKTST